MDYLEFKGQFDRLKAQMQSFVDAWFDKPLTVSVFITSSCLNFYIWFEFLFFIILDIEEVHAQNKTCNGTKYFIDLQRIVILPQVKQWSWPLLPSMDMQQKLISYSSLENCNTSTSCSKAVTFIPSMNISHVSICHICLHCESAS